MKQLDELHLNRCNVQVEDEVKDWYMYKAKSMGMSMSQLMSFVLSSWYDNAKNSEAVQIISKLTNSQEIKEANSQTIELLKLLQTSDSKIQ